MDRKQPDDFDIETHLAALRPPSTPNESFSRENANLYSIRTWKKYFSLSVLAGLSTETDFHANGIRIDWLQRLVFSKSEGRRKPRSAELSRVLNDGLERAKVLRLEDPIEDLFCELITTAHGDYRIFPGQWEAAAPYTQTLLDAFESLPNGSLKQDALKVIYPLLRLSDELAERASVCRLSPSAGEPKGLISVPNTEALKQLARRVKFTDAELGRLDISKGALAPFLLQPHHFPHISNLEVGETPLVFHPLLSSSNGIIVASPANISLAIRAVIVSTAQKGGMDKYMLSAMLTEQQKYSEESGFWPVRSLELPPPNQHFLRSAVCQFAERRFLHVIQVPATFDQFPQKAFGSVRTLGDEASQAIANDVSKFWQFLEKQPNCQESITVLLLSGWGTPHVLSPPIRDIDAPKHWLYLALSFADAAVLGACDNGKFRDICRILEQVERLEAGGFSFQNVNGILNLFGFWRSTNGNLIPEHHCEIRPPCNLILPTDELLGPRIEAARKRDVRSLPFPDSTFKVVQRTNWDDEGELQPIYGSLEDVAQGRLLGAVFLSGRTWWIESVAESGENREWRYRIWNAVLQWLVTVGPDIIAQFPQAFPVGASNVEISIPVSSDFEGISPSKSRKADLPNTVVGSRESDDRHASVQILPEWLGYLGRIENDAEVELIAAILEKLTNHEAPVVLRKQLSESIHDSIHSKDWRWLHAHQAFTPLDRLASIGLIGQFKEISLSTVSLAKCGSIWGFRERTDDLEVNGEEECRDFLTEYRNYIINELVSYIRRFDRERLVVLAAYSYQAARGEQSHWRKAIRALRAIHGVSADAKAIKRQYAINAVQRAAKSICEIAACESPSVGGANPDDVDLEEMFAKALLLFGNGQLFASIRSGLIKPTLRISPAGDLLSDRSVFETTLRPGAEWMSTRALNEAHEAYKRDRSERSTESKNDKLQIDETLRKVIEAEYGVSAEAVVDLQYALIQIAEERGSGAFVISLSELTNLLAANNHYPSDDPTALLERLTLSRRSSWRDLSTGLTESDIDLGRFDRPFSLINRPLLEVGDSTNRQLLVAPILVGDSTVYSLSGLMNGGLQNQFWVSEEARCYVGAQTHAAGMKFEESVAERLESLGLKTWTRCKLSWALNQKVDKKYGDIDVLAVSADQKRVWVIEAKNLQLCRTETEVAARLSEYRGQMIEDRKGRHRPDKMLRHVKRVQYLRQHSNALCGRLKLTATPDVRGLLIVDAPQPMNFYMLDQLEDGDSAFLDVIDSYNF